MVEQVSQSFPAARCLRLDRDTTQRRGALRKLLTRVARNEVDIIVGTQMITKGHHFPNITLVGVVDADLSLNFPDYKAAERTFTLLLQVAGRAGRGQAPGRVVVQTRRPDHYVIDCVRDHDRDRFVDIEMKYRRDLFYPPFSRLVNLVLAGNDPARVDRGAGSLFGELTAGRKQLKPRQRIDLLGPAPAPLARLGGKTRRQILIKAGLASEAIAVARLARHIAREDRALRGLGLTVDVDPANVM